MDRMQLKPQHISLLFLLAKGLTNVEIARQMNLSPSTVKWYLSQLFGIFGVSNRTELIGLFISSSDDWTEAVESSLADSARRITSQ